MAMAVVATKRVHEIEEGEFMDRVMFAWSMRHFSCFVGWSQSYIECNSEFLHC